MRTEKTLDLSVVVPTYNQSDLLQESLRALADQTLPKDAYEIVVVDDGSTDQTEEVLRAFGPPVKVIRFPENRGRSAARNAGIRAASASLIVLVDSDIIVRPDFLASHLHVHHREGPGILSRGPVIDVPNIQSTRDGQIPHLVASPAYLTTANAALAKDALVRAGLFDEGFSGYGWEDFDLGLRLKRLGVRRVWCRQAVAFHVDPHQYWDEITKLLAKEEARARNAVYFYHKHPTVETRWLIQTTRLHRVLYWLQTGGGLLTPTNIENIVDPLRRSGRVGLAFFMLRGVLNRYYLRTLESELRTHGPVDRTRRGSVKRPSMLLVSNGHGEDAVGMALAQRLQPAAAITAFPLVGTGGAYDGVVLLEPRRTLPSGGFGLRGAWRGLWADLWAGGLRHWLRQRATLRRQRGRHDLVVAVGDVYCLQMAALAGSPVAFVATAKSQYAEPHRMLERFFLHRYADAIFTRDQVTADTLQRAGLPARYVGNPLMDTIGPIGVHLRSDDTHPTVTILPGSRADAYGNLRPLLQMCNQIAGRVPSSFLCALAPSIDLEQVKSGAAAAGWVPDREALRRGGVTVTLTRAFGDAIHAADVVVGLAGTANEQAAGLGKPVVTFAGPGAQVTQRFVNLQKRLLGDALIVTPSSEEAANAVVRLLQDPAERAARGSVGRQRMGEPGAVDRIAENVLTLLQEHGTPSPHPSPPAGGEGG